MLAEIFILRLEVMARTSKESITRSTSQFVPVTLPAAPSTPTSDSIRVQQRLMLPRRPLRRRNRRHRLRTGCASARPSPTVGVQPICSFGGFVPSAFAIGAPDRLHPPGMS